MEEIRAIGPDEWAVVPWLWQAFREDLAPVVDGLPYADGRYRAAELRRFPSADTAGAIAWREHPRSGSPAPVAFALVDGLIGDERSVVGFWVAPVARRSGVGRRLALDVLRRQPGPWRIGFQHENVAAGAFWRRTADEAFGPAEWTEERHEVPGLPEVPPDHVIRAGG